MSKSFRSGHLQVSVHRSLATGRDNWSLGMRSRLTVAVQRPEHRGVGVVRPPTQAVVEVTGALGRRRGGHCGDGEQ